MLKILNLLTLFFLIHQVQFILAFEKAPDNVECRYFEGGFCKNDDDCGIGGHCVLPW